MELHDIGLELFGGLFNQYLPHRLKCRGLITVRYISRLENTAPNLTLELNEKIVRGLSFSTSDLMDSNEENLIPGAKEMLG